MSDKRLLFHQCKLSSTAIRDLRSHGITPVRVEHLNDIRFFGNDGEWTDVLIDALDSVVNTGSGYDVKSVFFGKQQTRLKTKVAAAKAEKTA
jgi:hypothetical protein